MADYSDESKMAKLRQLKTRIGTHKDWWLFPEQLPIKGFMGTGETFIIGDQPSQSEWPPSHPNRKAFYGLLEKAGGSNAHLTDIYKRRGRCSELRKGLPRDFSVHLDILRQEIDILEPKRILALGHLAHQLLLQHMAIHRKIIKRVWHFSYVVRKGRMPEYEIQFSQAFQIAA